MFRAVREVGGRQQGWSRLIGEDALNSSTLRVLLAASVFAFTPGNVFSPYFAGVSILGIGLFDSRKELARAHRQEKLLTLGRVFFAAPMAVFGAQHFTDTQAVSQLVPSWIPGGRIFCTYLVGTCLIAAALSIVVKKHARLAASLLATMLMMFILCLHIPNIIADPRNVLTWAFGFRDLAFSGGALAFAASLANQPHVEDAPKLLPSTPLTSMLITIARIFISVSVVFFGVTHFVHPEFLPADDLDHLTPTWIPGHTLWAYLAGAVFILAGTSILLDRKARLAATYLAIAVLVLLVFVFLPMMASNLSDIQNGLNYFASTLAFSGALLLLAAALQGERTTR
jgi:uncharacterized membrane protein